RGLRIGPPRARMGAYRLYVVHWIASRCCRVAEQIAPWTALQDSAGGRHLPEHAGIQRNPPRDRAALPHFASFVAHPGDLALYGGEYIRRKKIRLHDISLPVEILPVLRIEQVRQFFTPKGCHEMSKPGPRDKQPQLVQSKAADQGIVFERFGAGGQRSYPKGRHEPAHNLAAEQRYLDRILPKVWLFHGTKCTAALRRPAMNVFVVWLPKPHFIQAGCAASRRFSRGCPYAGSAGRRWAGRWRHRLFRRPR